MVTGYTYYDHDDEDDDDDDGRDILGHNSLFGKKKRISRSALIALSLPWHALRWLLVPKTARILDRCDLHGRLSYQYLVGSVSRAFAESVGPMSFLQSWMAEVLVSVKTMTGALSKWARMRTVMMI